MRHVIIYRKDKLDDIYFEKECSYESYEIKECEQGIEIQSKVVFENTVYRNKDYSFICMPLKNIYSFFYLQMDMVIGRSKTATISIDLEWISNLHAHLYQKENTYFIEDLNSTNGIYYQSKRVDSIPLKNGTEFYLVNIKIIFYDTFLLIAYPISSHPIPSYQKQDKKNVQSIINQPPIIFQTQIISLENYVMDRDPMKQKLFQAIGSSLLILCSSFISCFLMYSMYPEQKTQLLSMVLMSGSMAISFLCFGIYNREANYKTQLKQNEINKHQYLTYLDTVENQVDEIISKQKEEFRQCIQDALQFKKMDRVVLAKDKMTGIEFDYRKWNYQQVNHEMVTIIRKWIEQHSFEIEIPIYLEEKTYYVTKGKQWAYGLFEALCVNNHYKVVWVTQEVNDSILAHPMCMINQKRLWIHDMESFQRIEPFLSKYPIVFFIEDSKYDLKNGIKIHLNTQGIDPIPYQMNEETYRDVLLSSYQERKISLSSILNNTTPKDEVNLKVCLGLDDYQQPIWLDLQEGKDGPHGLVAGSTGFGKSEWMSNVLLQLVYQNHPTYFQYILIDFKGGAFGSTFTSFAHFAGMITNLDEDSTRFLVYIHQFVKERQMILKQFQEQYPGTIAHVDAYNQKHKKNPLSHVFIIVDEFAQMKTQAMELLNEMKQLSRIGRSLGIHLILSTQKPMGVIDDQIWANSSFHACLKVLSKQDSKEVLHTDHAYDLQEPGEFILHSQNQEQKGRSFYIHDQKECSHSYIEVNEMDEIIKDVHRVSYVDYVSNEIQNRHYSQNLIIPPSLNEHTFKNEWCVYEDMEQKKNCVYSCAFGQVVTILTNDIGRVSTSIISTYQEYPIYTLHIENVASYVDGCFFDDSLYWKLMDSNRKAVLILHLDSFELWSSLFSKENFCIFVLLNQYKNKFGSSIESFDKLCIYYANIENIRNFFQNYSLSSCIEKGILKRQECFYACRLNSLECTVKEEKEELVEKMDGFEIGIDTQYQSIYWNRKNPLLICFLQKSVKPKIEQLLVNWQRNKELKIETSIQQEFEICVLDIANHQEQLMSKTYLQNQYDWDVLWVGKGCIEYAYLLHKKVPMQLLDMVYWHEDQEKVLRWKEY